ncbi:hypothetical protein JRO89_XS06G0134300 [Xanthoceras sorbifolium]|uniref:Uncharacterized protein n=1 Tax=Xanthoceras sorbifolium TaxID=99658 RepID=A0ABQ8HY17_9ROSI|nr:hypothetical protein JRO89_XS06G0134300 [Xanthoceras sorbifolium]
MVKKTQQSHEDESFEQLVERVRNSFQHEMEMRLCPNDLATKQIEQEIDVLYDFPEESVLPYGHVYHSICLLHLA